MSRDDIENRKLRSALVALEQPTRTLSLIEYRSLVSGLDLPTTAQKRGFSRFVSNDHSWYKILEFLPPGKPFAFFIDPRAGFGFAKLEEDFRWHSAPVTRQDRYRSFPTESYRQHFGYLNYAPPHFAPTVIDLDLKLCALPQEIVDAGTVSISAVVHRAGAQVLRDKEGHRWPEESGGLRAWIEIVRRARDLDRDPSCRTELIVDDLTLRNEPYLWDGYEDAVLDKLLMPERERQRQTMVEAMGRVCDMSFG